MAEQRKGRQTPTQSVVLPYYDTKGQEAINLYNESGRIAQESALKYVVTDSKNPQTIFCGTPPTPVSSGTVFTKLRNATLAGKTANGGWAEWSVEKQSDVRDKDL